MASTLVTFFNDHSDNLAIFGAVAASYIALNLFTSLWSGFKTHFLARRLGLSTDLKKLGSWAVVTGATDGIGKGYASELARKGINVVLVSRSPEKLADVAQEIGSKYKVQTKVVAVDFTKGQEIYDKIKKELQGMDIGTLVNNVGISYNYPQYFGEQDNDTINEDIVRVNAVSVVKMTEIILPLFLEKKKGAIINLSSSSALFPSALLATYGATKSFVGQFTRALKSELQCKGVILQVVYPFFVSTKMSKIRRTSFFVPNAVSYARSALATVGLQDETYGCFSHAIQGWFVQRLPVLLITVVVKILMMTARKGAQKKLQKKQTTKAD